MNKLIFFLKIFTKFTQSNSEEMTKSLLQAAWSGLKEKQYLTTKVTIKTSY